jgi:hypothetical protein
MHSLMSCVATQRSNSRAHCTHLTHSGSPANAIARCTRMSALKLPGLAIRCATLLGEMEAGEAHGDAVKQEQMSPDRDRAPQKRRALLQRRASPGLPRASGLLDVPSTGGIGERTVGAVMPDGRASGRVRPAAGVDRGGPRLVPRRTVGAVRRWKPWLLRT